MEQKGCESIIHDHDRDLWVIMVGWVDVLYSDWGDFRSRRAVDKPSFIKWLAFEYFSGLVFQPARICSYEIW